VTAAAFEVGVVGALVQPVTAWGQPRWYPRAVLEAAPATPPGTPLPGGEVYLGPAVLEFHRVETATYRDNLVNGTPLLWVVLEGARVVAVTADPAEGEAFTEAGIDLADRTVETVPMPPSLAAALATFVEEHHLERKFLKRQRDRVDPEALGRRARVEEDE
jgi:hypothetical protein